MAIFPQVRRFSYENLTEIAYGKSVYADLPVGWFQ